MNLPPAYPPALPPTDPSRAPDFHHWNEHPKRWERLGARLMDIDERFQDVDLFDVDGNEQFGIDAIGGLTGQTGKVVQSAKCYPRATPAKIRIWSDHFLDHWESRWKQEGVQRFILCIAAPNIITEGNRKQVELETKRFAALGLEYELWGPEQVWKRLRADRDGVNRFLGPFWEAVIFGPQPSASLQITPPDLLAQLTLVHGAVADQVDARISGAEEDLRVGRLADVETLLAQITAPKLWPLLTAVVQARALRLSATIKMQRGDLDGTEADLLAAGALHAEEPRLEALLADRRHDAETGLRVLGEPVSAKGRRTKAALLIGAGRPAEAEAELRALAADEPDEPETLRLCALAALYGRRWPESLKLAERAYAAAPNRLTARQTLAIIRYVNGLSPFTPPSIAFHPNPAPPSVIRRDSSSLARRAAAAEEFLRLHTDAPYLSGSRLWAVACLAALPGRGEEATQLCAELLREDACCLEAAFWSIARDDGLDLTATAEALTTRLKAGTATRDEVHCLVLIWLNKDTLAPKTVVSRLASVAVASDQAAVAEVQRWVSLLGEKTGEANVGERVGGPADVVSWVLANGGTADLTGAPELLSQLLAETPPSLKAIELAEMLAAYGRWSILEPHIHQIAAFDSEVALSLALHILHHVGSPSETLAFLDTHRDGLGAPLSPSIRRIEITALSEASPGEAVKAAQGLLADTAQSVDRHRLVGLLLATGNVQGALTSIRHLLREGAVGPDDAVRYSVAVTTADRALAVDLWRAGLRQGLKEDLLLIALTQGYRLGLDSEMAGLMGRLNKRAESGATDIRAVTIEEVGQLIRDRQESIQAINDKLLGGDLPIHIAPSGLIGSLAQIYRLDGQAGNRFNQRVILMRHGARGERLEATESWTESQLILDVTGLLVADQLGLLDQIEDLKHPIRVSPSLLDALYSFEQDTAHQQAARFAAARSILHAQASGRLGVAEPESEAVTVRHERSRRDGDQPGPTVDAVRAALAGAAPLTADDESLAEVPLVGGRLVFADNTLETLVVEGEIDPLLEAFDCAIPTEVLIEIQQEVERAEAGQKQSAWLAALRERVADGLQRGRYVFLKATPKGPPTEMEGDEGISPLEACLRDALSAPTLESGLAWIDDRYLTGFTNANGNVIVGVVEILNTLVREGRLTDEERRAKLLALREGGAIFIPLQDDEVLEPLKLALIRDGAVVETSDLRTIRRNFSAAQRLDDRLKLRSTDDVDLDGRPDELWFIRTSQKLAERCLRAIWEDPAVSKEARIARSNWIWSALRMERCVRNFSFDEPGQGNDLLAVLFVSGLFSTGVTLDGGSYAESLERQREYMAWLNSVALKPRAGRDLGDFIDRVAQNFRVLYASTFTATKDELEAQVVSRLRMDQISLLPEPLQQKVLSDAAFSEEVGVVLTYCVKLDGDRYDSAAFWGAAARAARRGRAFLISLDGHRLALTRDGLDLVLGSGKNRIHVSFMDVLAKAKKDRPKAAKAFLAGLDLNRDRQIAFCDRLDGGTSDAALSRVLTEAVEAVIENQYAEVERQLGLGTALKTELFLPPPPLDLLHSLRLDGRGDFSTRIVAAERSLTTQVGQVEAFHRLGGLPVNLAGLIADPQAVEALSPIARLHCIAAAATERTEAETVQAVMSIEITELDLLSVLLSWSHRGFRLHPDWLEIAADNRIALIWTHAHRLFDLFVRVGADLAAVAQAFRERAPSLRSIALVAGDPEAAADVASPDDQLPQALTFHGLAYAIRGEVRWSELPLDLQRQVGERFLMNWDGKLTPHYSLLFASHETENRLASWLAEEPPGLFAPELGPRTSRATLVDRCIPADGSPPDLEGWSVVAAVVRGRVDPERESRVRAALTRLEPSVFLDSSTQSLAGAASIIAAGLRLGGPISDGDRLELVHRLARACADRFRGRVTLELVGGNSSPAGNAAASLIDVVLALSMDPDAARAQSRLHEGVIAAAHGWPSAAAIFRNVLDHLVRQSDVGRAGGLWRAFVQLRSWP